MLISICAFFLGNELDKERHWCHSKYVTRDVLDQMYKLYVRPHLDHQDEIYYRDDDDPEMSSSLTKRLESVPYSAAVAVAGAWKGTSYDKLLDDCITDHGFGDSRIFTAWSVATHFFCI